MTTPPEGTPRTDDRAMLERALFEVKRVVVGQDHMVERMLVGLVARGHVLLEGVPGVAKTLAVRTLADVIGGTFTRLQFTPDLMPGDIVGTRVWRPSSEAFDTELSLDRSLLLMHVFDLDVEARFVADFKASYERPLMEIFE